MSESLLDFQREQIDILKTTNPDWWVTHNGTFEHIDHWGMGTDLDFYSVDIYPGFHNPQSGVYSGSSFKLSGTAAATGTVLATAQLGTRDARNHKIPTTPPGGGLDELFGLRITEWGTAWEDPISINYNGKPGAYEEVYEIAELRGAESIASWFADREGGAIHQAVGHAALTRNPVGQGETWYFTSLANGEAADDLVSFLAGRLPVEPLAAADPFVEVVVRQSNDQVFWFVLNHYAESKMVAGLPSGLNLLTEYNVPGMLELEPYGVAVVKV